MSDVALQQVPGVYEPSLFGTYSKKIGMWLFLLSDSLTFGALLYAYTYGRISTPNWPTPFHSESIRNATFMTAFLLTSSLTMVFAVRSAVMGNQKAQRLWLFATMACGLGFVVLHGREWTNLIAEGLTLPVFPVPPGEAGNAEFVNVTKTARNLPPPSSGSPACTCCTSRWAWFTWVSSLCDDGSFQSCWDCGWWLGWERLLIAHSITARTYYWSRQSSSRSFSG